MKGVKDDAVLPRPGVLLRAVEVIKRYRDGDRRIEAVSEVTLDVERRQLVVLKGPSGSGKTTLLGILGGLVTPTSGDVTFEGRSVVQMRDHHRARFRRRHIGFVFQELALVEGMSVRENLLLPFAPLGGARAEDIDRASSLADRFGVTDKLDASVELLSGGERQRAAIVRALVTEPAALLLDEPTAHLDVENARAVVDLLVALRDEGRAVVAATHDPRLYEDGRVDRVVTMVDGCVVS